MGRGLGKMENVMLQTYRKMHESVQVIHMGDKHSKSMKRGQQQNRERIELRVEQM